MDLYLDASETSAENLVMSAASTQCLISPESSIEFTALTKNLDMAQFAGMTENSASCTYQCRSSHMRKCLHWSSISTEVVHSASHMALSKRTIEGTNTAAIVNSGSATIVFAAADTR